MKIAEIITIKKDSLEEYLYINGLIVKVKNHNLYIIDMYPPMPADYKFSRIYSVNKKDPINLNNWSLGKNFVQTDTGVVCLYFDGAEQKNNFLLFTNHLTYFRVKSFSLKIPPMSQTINEYLIIDLRHNYGGKISQMNEYIELFKRAIKQKTVKKAFILVGHSTASSAEILVDLLMQIDPHIILIGSETYKKEFAYKHIIKNDHLVMVPVKKIRTNFRPHVEFNTNDFYPFLLGENKAYFVDPQCFPLN
ncbi:hypothetical protein ABXL94_14335 [Enterococcus gallinarum]|uniref:hypothetical protein n=1 Tax=Enterococcus gallinarum TaxID=1353 RepID=UPI00338EA606